MTPLKKRDARTTKKKGKRGRPRLLVDLKAAESLAEIGATYEEAAKVLGVSVSTFKRRMAKEGDDLRMVFTRGWANCNITLRRKQMELAEKGDCSMLIWLGKQRLGQSNRGSLEVTGRDGEPVAGPTTILYLPDNGRDDPGGKEVISNAEYKRRTGKD